MTDIQRYGIHRVRLPLPFRLDHVHCYAIEGRDGWAIVDAGLNYEPARRAWFDFMRAHNFGPGEITGIYLTHYHPDHYGASGWLQQLSGAPVYMSMTESALAEKIWREDTARLLADMFRENGMPEELVSKILAGVAEMRSRVIPHPRITTVAAGDLVRLGGLDYRVLLTPGHSDGHICLYNEKNGILLSGDHLLPKISSNISLWPLAHPDPLDNFLNSLAENHRLEIKLALPAHGDCFTGVQERIAELEEHHRVRLSLIREIASRGVSAYQVCREVFGDRLSLHEVRFAMTETLAHLVYLVGRGQLKRCRTGNVYTYSAQ